MLKALRILFFASFAMLFADDNDAGYMSDFGGDPSGMVAGCINSITGDLVIRRDDLVVKGQEPIRLPLLYSPKSVRETDNVYCGWDFCERYLTAEIDEKSILKIYEKSGISLSYDYDPSVGHGKAYNQPNLFKIRDLYYLLTNTSLRGIGARYNPMFNRVYSNPLNLQEIIVSPLDGSIRRYKTSVSAKRLKKEKKSVSKTFDFYLQSETLPNGNMIVYHWQKVGRDRDRMRVVRIESKSPKGKVFAWVNIQYDPPGDRHRKGMILTTSDQRSVTYEFDSEYKLQKKGDRVSVLKKIEYSYRPNETYTYYSLKRKDIYPEWIIGPDDRQIKVTYNHKGVNPSSGITINKRTYENDKRYGRVGALHQPLGNDTFMYRSHYFRYFPGEPKKEGGFTNAFDAYDNLTRFLYNKDLVLTSIERFIDKDQLFSKEHFDWIATYWLQHKTLVGSDKAPIFSLKYEYDDMGNIKKEFHYGDLTGKAPKKCLVMDDLKPQLKGAEEHVIKRDYYGNHLLKREEVGDRVTDYFYVGHTERLRAKFVYEKNNQFRQRVFYFYDDGILTCEITDNGTGDESDDLTGVTKRLIKRITPNPKTFMYGMPHIIEEKYLDLATHQEVLLRKRVLHYQKKDLGNVSRIDHYDADDHYRYTLTYSYDDQDRLVAQTDPLGRTRTIAYDANYNPKVDDDPNENFVLEQHYDRMNRPIQTTQVLPEGEERTVTHRYNLLNQKIEEQDFRDNITHHEYDPFGHPTKTTFPAIESESGVLTSPVITRTYNALGKPTSETDPEGNITTTVYTSRGRPHQITYADGYQETFVYDSSGHHVVEHTLPGGTRETFEYDAFDRITLKQTHSSEGERLSEETFKYDALSLLAQTAPDGTVTTYTYDSAGRKIEEKTLDRVTQYSYDALGRLHRITRLKEGRPEQVLVKEYDLLDRVKEERQEDADGLVYSFTTYTYDDFSNQTALIKEVQVGESKEQFFYDPLRRIIKTINPMGEVTTTEYDDFYENSHGQKVLRQTTTDPMGKKTIETFDVFGNLSTLEKQNAAGKTLLHEAFFYNLNQQKTKQISTLYDPDKTIIKTWDYNERSRLIELREAVGTPLEKVTHYSYTPDGHMETVTKPDGVVISYTYDGLGRQTSIQTSDGSCHYALKHDKMGNVIRSDDLIHHKTTTRVYNHFGELLEETLANNHSLKRTYDSLGRKTALLFSNDSQILYDYTPYHLAKVERISRNGTSLYAHYYTEYDRSFNVTEELLLSKEPLFHTVDLLGRRIETDSPYSNEQITQIDPCGNVLSYLRTLEKTQETSTFTYDDLDQLIEEKGRFEHNYAYDSHHNRIQKDASTYELNALHELTATSETTYEHDLNGNRTLEQKATEEIHYTYDGLDRLTQIQSGEYAIRFSYDSWNRCLTLYYFKLSDGVWGYMYQENLLYDEQNELGAFPHELRILGQGRGAEIGATVAIEKNHTLYVPLHDLFGNIIALLDQTNTLKESYRFTAFGEEEVFTPQSIQTTDSLLHNPWRYQSKRKVGQLVSFGRRFYDPETGRWLSPDPMGFDEGPNLYQYVTNNPMVYFDLYGEFIKKLESIEEMEKALTFDYDFEERNGGYPSRNWTYIPERDYSNEMGHPLITGERQIGFVGGIDTKFEEHQDNVRYASLIAGNMPIYSTYNGTRGMKKDLEECKMGLNLIGTTPANLAYKRKLDFFLYSGSDKPYLDVAFSQGAIHNLISQLLLPKEFRDRTILVAIAPAVFAPRELYKKAFYYCTSNDPVPKLQNVFGVIPPEKRNITTLDTGKKTDFGHSFQHPVYRPKLEEHFEKYFLGAYD